MLTADFGAGVLFSGIFFSGAFFTEGIADFFATDALIFFGSATAAAVFLAAGFLAAGLFTTAFFAAIAVPALVVLVLPTTTRPAFADVIFFVAGFAFCSVMLITSPILGLSF